MSRSPTSSAAAGSADLELAVDSRALIPRPETELLVEVGVELAPATVLDVGTGSGAVALALAAELREAEVVATDSSPAALELAAENAARLGLAERVRFEPGTLPADARFDLLVANLPYVAEAEWAGLAPEITDWEPRRRAARRSRGPRRDSGRCSTSWDARAAQATPAADVVALEVGAGQAPRVGEMLADAGFRMSKSATTSPASRGS